MADKKRRQRYADAKLAYEALMKFYPFTLDDLDGEEWRDIDGYDGRYQVSNFARVKSFSQPPIRILRPHVWTGYLYVGLFKNGTSKKIAIHRLVAMAFIDNPESKTQVNHRDGNKLNNHVSNLEWCTVAENNQHAHDTGLSIPAYGEDVFIAKLTNEQALYIRENPDNLSSIQLAEMFGVGKTAIADVRLGHTYKTAGGTVYKSRKIKKPTFLSAESRAEIRRVYKPYDSEFGANALAKRFNVTRITIWNIINEK